MASVQEYASIVAQLDGFLQSEKLDAAIDCITSAELRAKLMEIDDKWEGLRERGAVTLERLKAVVLTVRQGLFCGEGHLFYVQVRNMDRAGVGEYVYPADNTGSTFEYVLADATVYAVDIKNLSTHITPNLYAYESDGSLVTDMNDSNPFNLSGQRQRGDQGQHGPILKYLPFAVRLYAFSLDADDRTLELTLRNAENKIVLTLRFELAGGHGKGSVGFMLGALLQTCV